MAEVIPSASIPNDQPVESAYVIGVLPLALQEQLQQTWDAIRLTPNTLRPDQVEAFTIGTHAAVTEAAKLDVEHASRFTQEPHSIIVPNTNHEIERWLERYYAKFPPGKAIGGGDSVLFTQHERYITQCVAMAASLAPHFPQISHTQELGHLFEDAGLVLPTLAMRSLLAAYGDRISIFRRTFRKS